MDNANIAASITRPAQVPEPIRSLTPTQPFFIGIDSDGSALDSMDLKQKQCFVPNISRCFGLEPIASQVRQVAEFVGLYSRWRGINRYLTLAKDFELLGRHAEVIRVGFRLPDATPLARWVATQTSLSNASLCEYLATDADPFLRRALDWSEAVNRDVEAAAGGVRPFGLVRESLLKARAQADVMVVSATPWATLSREWRTLGLADCATFIAGPEMGVKQELLRVAARAWSPERMLLISDAPGDLASAQAVGALFYPILAGREAASWERFHGEALERFFAGHYRGAYEAALIEEFLTSLPEEPPWEMLPGATKT